MAAVVEYVLNDRDARVETYEGARFLCVRGILLNGSRFVHFLSALVDDSMPKQWRRVVSVSRDSHVQGLLTAAYIGTIGILYFFDLGICAAPGEDAVPEDDEPEGRSR